MSDRVREALARMREAESKLRASGLEWRDRGEHFHATKEEQCEIAFGMAADWLEAALSTEPAPSEWPAANALGTPCNVSAAHDATPSEAGEAVTLWRNPNAAAPIWTEAKTEGWADQQRQKGCEVRTFYPSSQHHQGEFVEREREREVISVMIEHLRELREAAATALRYIEGEVVDGLRTKRHGPEIAANIAEHQARNLRSAVEKTGALTRDGYAGRAMSLPELELRDDGMLYRKSSDAALASPSTTEQEGREREADALNKTVNELERVAHEAEARTQALRERVEAERDWLRERLGDDHRLSHYTRHVIIGLADRLDRVLSEQPQEADRE